MKDFYRKMLETADNIDIKILSDEHCCKLLAWIYLFGSGTERVVFDVKLHGDILNAQKRLNIIGGEIPNSELFEQLKFYLKSVKYFTEQTQRPPDYKFPNWCYEICDYYNLSYSLLN